MPAMDTLLFNDPEVKGLAFAILEECTDLQAFGCVLSSSRRQNRRYDFDTFSVLRADRLSYF